ncbi:MAG: malectin domain-containing carbohydrate-binding protein, partial [Candidatus Sumerlaeota bacterium]
MVITQSGNDMGAVNLNTGEPYLVPSGITGQMGDFAGFKRYGCGTGIACTNMMIFRSGNAGYYDLNTNSGTGNWGGFKTGCTINLMPANGLIVAPEYTRTCGCSYQFQTSCAMIHRDDVEQWACNKNLGAQYANQGGRLLNVGFNFGAVGDRVDDDGIFWMEYPFGEPEFGYNYQIPVDVTVSGEEVNYFRHHMLTVDGECLNWVSSSGVEVASSISIDMVRCDEASPACAYDVYLYFVEPNVKAIGGDRVFSASVNGNSVGTLDLAAQAGPRKIVVKKLTGIIIDDTLTIDLSATAGKTLLSGVGVECQN